METKSCVDEPCKPEAELTGAINRINDAVGRIHSMASYSRKINDTLYGDIMEKGSEACGSNETSCVLHSLSSVIEAVHDACTELDAQLSRQKNLV